MFAKKLLFILFIVCTSHVVASAEAPVNTAGQPIHRRRNSNGSYRPRAPGNVRIHFMYYAAQGECHFDLLPGTEYISGTPEHLQTHAEYHGNVDAFNPILYMQLELGIYHITYVTDDRSIYSGNISIGTNYIFLILIYK